MDDQTDIKFMKQEEFNTNIVKRLEELEDFKSQALIRLDQGIENRTKAFDKIDQIEEDLDIIDIKLERIDDILVVHSNQSDNQRKNHFQLQKVFSEKVMELLEGTHGKDVPRITDKEQAIIDLGKTLFGEKPDGKQE